MIGEIGCVYGKLSVEIGEKLKENNVRMQTCFHGLSPPVAKTIGAFIISRRIWMLSQRNNPSISRNFR